MEKKPSCFRRSHGVVARLVSAIGVGHTGLRCSGEGVACEDGLEQMMATGMQ